MIRTRTISGSTAGLRTRLQRMPFVLALTLGLLMSLLQCVDCCSSFAANDISVTAISTDGSSPQNDTDRQMPAHACHCLCHISAETAAVISSPADLPPCALLLAEDQSPASLAGLPLFKPPRA